MHLFMLQARAAAGAGWDLKFLRGVEELLLQSSIQVLEVSWMRWDLVVEFIPLDVVVALYGLSLPLSSIQFTGVVVMVVVTVMAAVCFAICLAFVMFVVMMPAVAVTVLVWVLFMMIDVMEAVIMVAGLIAHGFLRVQWSPLVLWRGAVLPNLIDEEDFGHVVYDEHFSPVRNRLGLSTTEMNVHDEDGERGRGCDHSHCGYVVLP